MRWLAKLLRYGGGDTVLGYYETEADAQACVDEWNDNYQTPMAYIEPWDDPKATWPTAAHLAAKYANGLLR